MSVWLGCVLGFCILLPATRADDKSASLVGHEFLQQHCVHCHDESTTEGGLNLTDLILNSNDSVSLEKWAKVHDRVIAGEMPPVDEERPEAEESAQFVKLVRNSLNDIWEQRYRTHGRVGGRRLNPVEYEYTMRDLLAAPWLELKEMLPPDPEAHGFDNVAETQEISYVQLARYLEAAEVAIDGAMRLRPAPKPTKVRTWFSEEGRYLGRDWKERYGSLDNRPEWTWFWQQPNSAQAPRRIRNSSQQIPGWYRFRVRCRAALWDQGNLLPPEKGQVAWINTAAKRILAKFDLPESEDGGIVEFTAWQHEKELLEFFYATADDRQVSLKTKKKDAASKRNAHEEFMKTYRGHGIAVDWFEIEGPFADDSCEGAMNEQPWPSQSFQTLFGNLSIRPWTKESGLRPPEPLNRPDLTANKRGLREAFQLPSPMVLVSMLFLHTEIIHAETPSSIKDFVETHCLDCHAGNDAESGYDLESLSFDLSDTNHHRKWVKAYDRVRHGEMPPADAGQPKTDEAEVFLSTLLPRLISAEEDRTRSEGRSRLRRLSRGEHINALRDLLKLPHMKAGDNLPPDSLSDGFGKSSNSLPLSHVQIDRYLSVANSAIREAMAPQREPPQSQTVRIWVSDYRGETVILRKGKQKYETLRLINDSPFFYLPLKEGDGMPIVKRSWDKSFDNWPGNFAERQPGHVLDNQPFMDAVGIHDHADQRIGKRFKASVAGRYKIRIGAYAYRSNRGTVEPTDRTEVVAVFGGDRLLGTIDVTSEAKVQELVVWLNGGEEIRASAASLPLWRIEGGEKSRRYVSVDIPAVAFQGFELEGPLVQQWPPESHRRLFAELPMSPLEQSQHGIDYQIVSETPHQDARKLLASFMTEAYRRPIQPIDFDIPIEAFERRLAKGASFQEAMIAAYASVLSSPHFVLVPMSTGPLTPDQIASRLSLFLWNAPADGSLRASVTEEILGDPAKYRSLVDHMIDDARSQRFVHHFLDHWLDLRNIGVTEPDENLYSGYSPWLLESMRFETRAFFGEMLKRDLPSRFVFDSDFVMVNGALAELYGIDGIQGANVRPVSLDEGSIRGGIVTQASVLKVSANGTTTSPVVRGVYVMARLLGDPPPPPPEAVPAVEPDLSGATTLREQLAKHRADASCATCHQKIDPPGFALESFDVMGRFRKRYHSLSQGDPVEGLNRRAKPIKYRLALPVDSSGELPGGRSFRDIAEFRRLVLRDERAIARNLLEQLVIYATGAPVGIADREQIEEILDRTADNGYGLRSMIHGLVQSTMFNHK